MPPVPASTASGVRASRLHAVKPAGFLFPETSIEPDPENRAGDAARVSIGPGGSFLASPDCPPMASAESCLPHAHDGRSRKAPAQLVGIARLAASSPPAESRRKSVERPEYFALPVRSILNRCESERVPFAWTINPYRGCEFGCHYCYARYTHEYMELDGSEFERKIFVKENAGPLLARDLLQKYSFQPRASGAEEPAHIAIGTATDPYQPAETEFGVTRACLKELAEREGLSISITTKSNLIVRDLELLKRIAAQSRLYLNLTVTTMRPRLTRLLEPRAPRPDLRLEAVKRLRGAGLATGVFAMPLLPGITDGEEDLENVAAAASQAGAQWFAAGVLFLMPASKRQFLPFVREKFPRLGRQYEEWYAREAYAPEAYRRKISERVLKLRQKYNFRSRPWEEPIRNVPCAQLSLAWQAEDASGAAAPARSCAAG
jgi:DNA repair photolyase